MEIKSNKNTIIAGVVGLIAGVIGAVIIVATMMPKQMILTYESQFDSVDETVACIVKSVKSYGWQVSRIGDLKKTLKKHGKDLKPEVRVVKICHADYALEVLSDEKARYASSLMPCTIAVYTDDSGKVLISKMNTGLMGKMFGGTIARVMGGKVGHDEHLILSCVIKK